MILAIDIVYCSAEIQGSATIDLCHPNLEAEEENSTWPAELLRNEN